MLTLADRVSVVLLTFNCAHRLTPILDRLEQLGVAIVAVDNASSDDTVKLLRARTHIDVIALERNVGAVARNIGAARVRTPYVAFCDDDGYYEAEALRLAASALDRYPRLGLVNARILVGADEVLDPISAEMSDSPLPDHDGIPGKPLLGFMAGACVMRMSAFTGVGGYEPQFFMGGEEEPLALKLAAAGWQLRYMPEVVMHHHPSQANAPSLRAHGLRNALWSRWLFRRAFSAVTSTVSLLVERRHDPGFVRGVGLAVRGLPWVLRRRQPLSRELDLQLTLLDRHRRRHADAHRQLARREVRVDASVNRPRSEGGAQMTMTAEQTTQRPLALVTGASSGIGFELARQFAEHGYDLLINAENDEIRSAAAQLESTGSHVQAVQADLTSYDGVEQLYRAVVGANRPLEAAVLNAGVGKGGSFVDSDLEDDLEVVDLNVRSTVHLAKRVLDDMASRNHGKVLITSSIASMMPGSFQTVYNASKSFLQSFAEALQEELKDTDVTVTSLMPGPTDTNFFERAEMQDTKVGQQQKDDPAEVAKQGFEALMSGRSKIVVGSMKTKAQGIASKVLPDKAKAAMHRGMAEPQSDE